MSHARIRCAPRCGVTITEVIVVCGLFALLMGLLLPAVQAAREAGRRAHCATNLKQLGLAIHGYCDVARTLPVNVGPYREGPSPSPQRNSKGWIVSVLPQIDQQALYDRFVPCFDGDFFSGGGLMSPVCRDCMKTQLPILQCPSDPSVRITSLQQYEWEGIAVSVTSYKGVLGDNRIGGTLSIHPGRMPDCHSTGGCTGLFYRLTYQEPQTLAMVRDGTTNTFMLGEDVPAQNDESAAFHANGDYAGCNAPLNYFFDPPQPHNWWNVMSFRSQHPGGANFCMTDGSVRFIHESIDYALYKALSTKAEGEVASPP